MMPRIHIGQTIYAIWENHIYAYTIGYLGKDSLIVEGFQAFITPEFFFEDYNTVWFTRLDLAKKEVRRKYGRRKIIEVSQSWWKLITNEDD